MAARRPLFTDNFSRNLDAIEAFLGLDGASYFAEFFERLTDEIVPRTCRYPLSGRSFLDRSIHSTQAQSSADTIERRLRDLLEREQLSAGKVLQPVRVAISGGSVSPGIFESLAVLGRDRSLARIEAAIERLDGAPTTSD